MSDDGEKEPSVQSFGFSRSIVVDNSQPEQLPRPGQWSPGARPESAEEYDGLTDQLARELLLTCTPQQIAVIAAQHMIYADELKCALEANGIDFWRKVATETATTAFRELRKHQVRKRADAVRAGKKDVKALAESIAIEKWREDTLQTVKIGKMAEVIYAALQQTDYCKSVSSPDAVRRWIRQVAPAYAKQPGAGRRTQSDNRND